MFRRNLMWAIAIGCATWCVDAASADDVVVRKFANGSTASSVGIVDASEDVEIAGPQALTSDADGNLFILDQVNGRILRFNPKQTADEASILKMPATIQPSDLVVSKSDILVWDGSV